MDAGDDLEAVAAVLPCADIDDTVAFFQGLGFRLEVILPADDPAVAVVAGHGLRLRLQRGPELPARTLPPLRPAPWIGRGDGGGWKVGRAGMRYRDLLPDRIDGHVVASQIRIDDGGPVPDYVHWHEVAFQLIYCRRGWVRVVYEDQGPPFVLAAGDAVLQPPRIRHRVLECSPGLEVIELGCPAVHETRVDHGLALPTTELRPDRDFGGQRFVRHQLAHARGHDDAGFVVRDLGIAAATGGLAEVRVLRRGTLPPAARRHDADLVFGFVLGGSITLRIGEDPQQRLATDDVFVVPGNVAHTLLEATEDFELFEVVLRLSLTANAGG